MDMNQNIVLSAQKFSSDYFADANLDQEQFVELISEAMLAFPDKEDKVTFLTEVIRLGHLFLDNSQSVLSKLEEEDLSKTGIKSLY